MKYYEVAAKWWADKLRNIGPASFNNGDDSAAGGMVSAMATILAVEEKPAGNAADEFEKRLAEAIKEKMEGITYMRLSCDYNPCRMLYDIASEFNISASCFPWKTTMEITPERVNVSCGYGARFKTIYLKEN